MNTRKQQGVAGQPLPHAFAPMVSPFFGLLPQALWKRAKDFFIYSTDFLPLAANATRSQDIAIQADSDFLTVVLNVTVTETNNTTFVDPAPIMVLITDTGSGRNLQNQATHLNNLYGDGNLPGYIPFPKLIPAASTLSTQLQNLSATAYNVRVSYVGFKVFMFN